MTQLPHAFKRIRLELARAKDFPDGSVTHGYEFVAPLDGSGHLDAALWHKYRDHCRVRRFWGDEEETGRLIHQPGGPEHAHWMFDYADEPAYDDEPGYRFGAHSFRYGDYVSITDDTGEIRTFRVVSVLPVT